VSTNYVSTLAILTAIKAALTPLTAELNNASVPMFERIELYGSKQIGQALKDLIIIKDRVALIIPIGSRFEGERKGSTVISKKTTTIDVLVADRDYLTGQAADFGGSNNVGVVAMQDAVAEALTGNQLALPFVSLIPTAAEPLEIYDPKKKDSPGRVAWVVSFDTRAGDARFPLQIL
jgi:hypothetical protein